MTGEFYVVRSDTQDTQCFFCTPTHCLQLELEAARELRVHFDRISPPRWANWDVKGQQDLPKVRRRGRQYRGQNPRELHSTTTTTSEEALRNSPDTINLDLH